MGQNGSGLAAPGVRGLKNLDSTCYMNVGLQCLLQTPGLTASLHAAQMAKQSQDSDQKQTQRPHCPSKTYSNPGQLCGGRAVYSSPDTVVSHYLKLAEQVWDPKGERAVLDPMELKRVIDKVSPRYRGVAAQRDAVDFFLNVFTKHLHFDIKTPFPFSRPFPHSSPSPVPRRQACQAWASHLELRGDSFFTRNFLGQSRRDIVCSKCKETTTDFQPFQFLPLAPPHKQDSVRLVDLLDNMPGRHITTNWSCPLCGSSSKPSKVSEFVHRLPNLLMVLLQRVVRTKRGKHIKNTTKISFPLKGLDLSTVVEAQGPPSADERIAMGEDTKDGTMLYDLYSVVLHLGTPQRGHYIARVRNARTSSWHTFNDGRIAKFEMPKNVVQSRDAYVLFFCRREFGESVANLRLPWDRNPTPKLSSNPSSSPNSDSKRGDQKDGRSVKGFGFIYNRSLRADRLKLRK